MAEITAQQVRDAYRPLEKALVDLMILVAAAEPVLDGQSEATPGQAGRLAAARVQADKEYRHVQFTSVVAPGEAKK